MAHKPDIFDRTVSTDEGSSSDNTLHFVLAGVLSVVGPRPVQCDWTSIDFCSDGVSAAASYLRSASAHVISVSRANTGAVAAAHSTPASAAHSAARTWPGGWRSRNAGR